jgi:hypothetical protein
MTTPTEQNILKEKNLCTARDKFNFFKFEKAIKEAELRGYQLAQKEEGLIKKEDVLKIIDEFMIKLDYIIRPEDRHYLENIHKELLEKL